jgi:hypothetical protein
MICLCSETIATRVYALAETQSRRKIPDLGVPWSSHKLAPPTAFRWLPIESLPRRSNLNNTNHSRVTRPRRSRPKSGLFCSGTVNKIDVTDGFVEFLRFFLVSLKAEAGRGRRPEKCHSWRLPRGVRGGLCRGPVPAGNGSVREIN